MTGDSVSSVAAFGGGLVSFLSPCVLPLVPAYLSIITGLDVGQGAILLAVYSAGLGVPFLFTGLAFSRVAGALRFIKRHFTAVTMASASSLAFFGALLVLDKMVWLTARIQEGLDAVGLGRLVELG